MGSLIQTVCSGQMQQPANYKTGDKENWHTKTFLYIHLLEVVSLLGTELLLLQWVMQKDQNCMESEQKFSKVRWCQSSKQIQQYFFRKMNLSYLFLFFSAENTSQLVTSKFKNQKKSSQVFPRSKSQHTLMKVSGGAGRIVTRTKSLPKKSSIDVMTQLVFHYATLITIKETVVEVNIKKNAVFLYIL